MEQTTLFGADTFLMSTMLFLFFIAMTASVRANPTDDIHTCNVTFAVQSIFSDMCNASVFLDSEILYASHKNFETF